MDDRALLDLVGDIYDAVTEPARWPGVLERRAALSMPVC